MNSSTESGPESCLTGAHRASVVRIHHGQAAECEDILAVEEPLEIQLEYGARDQRTVKPISITMRTPGHDTELAAGFLMTEAVLSDSTDIASIESLGPNLVRVSVEPGAAIRTASLERNFYVTSSCGVCGKASLLALQTARPPQRPDSFRITPEVLHSLPAQLRDRQSLFHQTGGLHAAGLFNAQGELLALREDVGRHNAVDKLVGAEWLADRVPLHDRLLLLSGRASFELLQKAVMAGIPFVASVGAPSSLAVRTAQQCGITLVGFLRENSLNVYSGADRI